MLVLQTFSFLCQNNITILFQTDKAKFLQFVTGSSKVPLQGFATLEGMNGAQKFQIHRDDRSTDRLPSAHTW